MKKKTLIAVIAGSVAALSLLVLSTLFCLRVKQFSHPQEVAELSRIQNAFLQEQLDKNFPERLALVHALPYKTIDANLFINAKSAILIDTQTGSILFEKNADMQIPPASMTKLVEMYVVFEAVEKGEVSLDDIVPLPPQSWAINLPRDASIMFLAEGQQVTLNELLLGLAIASGNDASIAVANYICGSMEDFVKRMNLVVEDLGLTHTHFVESSGYSELNVTTAREFASFSRAYINRFGFALEKYHSQNVLRYPLQHNLAPNQQNQGDSQAVTQYNTNKLLGKLQGCDGLKTGYIDESGYNLALTAQRNNMRFLSVTMGGPGKGSVQGNQYRIADGFTLMNYAFDSFADYHAPKDPNAHCVTVNLAGAKEKSVRLVPAYDETFTVPFITGATPQEAANLVEIDIQAPKAIYGEVLCAKEYGKITYSLNGIVLRTVPLVADRSVTKASALKQVWDKAALFVSNRLTQ